MDINNEDLEKTQETPVITDDMEVTQPLEIVDEEEMNVQQTPQAVVEIPEAKEKIIETVEPIFSMEDAKEIATEPERRMGRIEKFQRQIAEIFNPIMNKIKGKVNPERESNEDKEVGKKEGTER